MLANPVDQKTLWYQCCRSNLAKLQTAAVSQEEKLSPFKAEFGQLPKVIYSSLLNKISFAVLCVTDTHCSLECSGHKKNSWRAIIHPTLRREALKIFAYTVGCDETMATEWTELSRVNALAWFYCKHLNDKVSSHCGVGNCWYSIPCSWVNRDSDSTKTLHQLSRNVTFSFSIRFYLCSQMLKLASSILWLVAEGEKIFCVIRRQVLSNRLAYHHRGHLELSRFGNFSGLPSSVAGAELFQGVHYRIALSRNTLNSHSSC